MLISKDGAQGRSDAIPPFQALGFAEPTLAPNGILRHPVVHLPNLFPLVSPDGHRAGVGR